jgi:hypothetical protein
MSQLVTSGAVPSAKRGVGAPVATLHIERLLAEPGGE